MSDRFEQIKLKYIGTFAIKQKEIQTAWDNKDVSLVHDLMHKLAGSSGAYGFDELSAQVHKCMELTLDSKDFNTDKLENCIQRINSILHTHYASYYSKASNNQKPHQ